MSRNPPFLFPQAARLVLAAGLLLLPGCRSAQVGLVMAQVLPVRADATLANEQINESSGIARSHAHANVFWTHNDSGDVPRLFAIGTNGADLGTFQVEGAAAVDWEDIASARINGQNLLYLGDFGDNEKKRGRYVIYVVEEPAELPPAGVGILPVARKITYAYDDKPRNCESMAVDPETGLIYLVAKKEKPPCRVYELNAEDAEDGLCTARRIAELHLPKTTAMDMAPDRSGAIVLTYEDAWWYPREPDQSWAEAFSGEPRQVRMPARKQGESICFDPDGRTLWLTSEQLPAPLFQVPFDPARYRE